MRLFMENQNEMKFLETSKESTYITFTIPEKQTSLLKILLFIRRIYASSYEKNINNILLVICNLSLIIIINISFTQQNVLPPSTLTIKMLWINAHLYVKDRPLYTYSLNFRFYILEPSLFLGIRSIRK